MTGTVVAGTGMAVPSKVLTSAELERGLGLPAGWIERRSGIRERRLAAPDEAASDLAAAAGERALAAAGLAPAELDMLILATSTPDHPLPPTAPRVLHRLGAVRAAGCDLAAACSGFIYGLAMADALIRSGIRRNVLLVGANVMSRRVDWTDPQTCVLFGDGAGALLLTAQGPGSQRGLLAVSLRADGSGHDLLMVPAGGSREPLDERGLALRRDRLRMDGSRLYRSAVRAMVGALHETLETARCRAAEIDWFVPHQANARMVAAVAREAGIPAERVLSNIDRYGNTSAASIPIMLDEAVRAGALRAGQLVALAAFGGGLTAGAAVLRW